jgi:hypothetical protein
VAHRQSALTAEAERCAVREHFLTECSNANALRNLIL